MSASGYTSGLSGYYIMGVNFEGDICLRWYGNDGNEIQANDYQSFSSAQNLVGGSQFSSFPLPDGYSPLVFGQSYTVYFAGLPFTFTFQSTSLSWMVDKAAFLAFFQACPGSYNLQNTTSIFALVSQPYVLFTSINNPDSCTGLPVQGIEYSTEVEFEVLPPAGKRIVSFLLDGEEQITGDSLDVYELAVEAGEHTITVKALVILSGATHWRARFRFEPSIEAYNQETEAYEGYPSVLGGIVPISNGEQSITDYLFPEVLGNMVSWRVEVLFCTQDGTPAVFKGNISFDNVDTNALFNEIILGTINTKVVQVGNQCAPCEKITQGFDFPIIGDLQITFASKFGIQIEEVLQMDSDDSTDISDESDENSSSDAALNGVLVQIKDELTLINEKLKFTPSVGTQKNVSQILVEILSAYANRI